MKSQHYHTQLSSQLFFILGVALLLGNCGRIEVIENSPSFELCLQERGTSQPSEIGSALANVPLELIVFFRCGMNESDELIEKFCTVEKRDGVLFVDSFLEVKRGRSEEDEFLCIDVIIRCDSPALDTGEYKITHGEVTREFAVPFEATDDVLDCDFIRADISRSGF